MITRSYTKPIPSYRSSQGLIRWVDYFSLSSYIYNTIPNQPYSARRGVGTERKTNGPNRSSTYRRSRNTWFIPLLLNKHDSPSPTIMSSRSYSVISRSSLLSVHQSLRPSSSLYSSPSFTRSITAIAMRGGAGVIGALSAYVLFQVGQRIDPMQRRRIRKTLHGPQAELKVFRAGALFLQRPEKINFIGEIFNSDPSGPIVITGPQGSGKTMLIKKCLTSRPGSIYLDLRAQPAQTGEALTRAFVTQAGYLLPPNELLGRAIFTQNVTVGAQTTADEIERAFRLITEVLREEKAKQWVITMPDRSRRMVPPILTIDELNIPDVAALSEDAAFWRFVEWTMFLTDNRLCHVVFATSLDVAETLDAYPGFRVRRQKVHVDFPRPATVHSYLHNVLNPFLVNVLRAVPRHPQLPAETGTNNSSEANDNNTSPSGNTSSSSSGSGGGSSDPGSNAKLTITAAGSTSSSPKVSTVGTKETTDKLSISPNETVPKSKESLSTPSTTPISVVDVKTPTTVEIGVPVVTKPKSSDGIGWIKRILSGSEADSASNNSITSTAMAEAKASEPIINVSPPANTDVTKTANILVAEKGVEKSVPSSSLLPNTENGPNSTTAVTETKDASTTKVVVPFAAAVSDKNESPGTEKNTGTAQSITISSTAVTATAPSDTNNANNAIVASPAPSLTKPPSSPTTVSGTSATVTPTIHPEDMDGEGPSALIAIAQAQAQAAAATAGTSPMATVPTVPVINSTVPTVPTVVPLVTTTILTTTSTVTKDVKVIDSKLSSPSVPSTAPNASLSSVDNKVATLTKDTIQSDNATVHSSTITSQPSVVASSAVTSITPSPPPANVASHSSVSPLSNPYAERWVFAPWGLTLPVRYTLEEWEIDRIVDVIGGHLKDLDTVVTAITKGKHWSAALERLVADGADQVERTLEYLLMSADGGPGGNAASTAATTGTGSGTGTGGGRRTRLRILSASRTVRGTGLPIPSWDYQIRPRPERLAAYGRYLRTWAMINELATRKYVPRRELLDRIFSGCPHELDFLADAGLVMSVNVKGMTKIEPLHTLETSASSPLEKNIPGTYISASSPRMRFAFRALVQDPRLVKHTNRIRASVKLSLLREEEQVLLRRLPEAVSERSYWYFQAQALLARDTALRTSVAKELVNMQAAAPVTGSDFLRQGLLTPPTPTTNSQGTEGAHNATGGNSNGSNGTVSNPSIPNNAPGSAQSTVGTQPTSSLPSSTPDLPLLGISSLISQFESVNNRMKGYEEEVLEIRKRLNTIRDTITNLETDATASLTMETSEDENERVRNEIIAATILNPNPGGNDTHAKSTDAAAATATHVRNAILERFNSDRAVVWALDGLPLPEERLPLQQRLWNEKGTETVRTNNNGSNSSTSNDTTNSSIASSSSATGTTITNNDSKKLVSSTNGTVLPNNENDSPYAFPLRTRYRRIRLYPSSDSSTNEPSYNASSSSNASSSLSLESTAAWINNTNPRNEYGTSYSGSTGNRGVRIRDEDSHLMNTVERGVHSNRSQQFGIPWEPDVSYSTGSILNQQNQQNNRRDLRRRYSNSDGYEDYDTENNGKEDNTSSDNIYAYGGAGMERSRYDGSSYGYSNTYVNSSSSNEGYERSGSGTNSPNRRGNENSVKKANMSNAVGRGVFTIRKNNNGNNGSSHSIHTANNGTGNEGSFATENKPKNSKWWNP